MGYGRADKVWVVCAAMLPSELPQIMRGGLPRAAGPGSHWMKKTFGVTTFRVYCSDAAQDAFWYPQSNGYGGKGNNIVHGAQLCAEYGLLPAKVIIPCIAHARGVLWRWEAEDGRRFCDMPTHLRMAHITSVSIRQPFYKVVG